MVGGHHRLWINTIVGFYPLFLTIIHHYSSELTTLLPLGTGYHHLWINTIVGYPLWLTIINPYIFTTVIRLGTTICGTNASSVDFGAALAGAQRCWQGGLVSSWYSEGVGRRTSSREGFQGFNDVPWLVKVG